MSGVVYIGKIESKILNKEVLMVKYNKAKRIMEEYEELCDFVGEFGEDVVEETEKILNVMLPKSYKSFLRDFGAGNFGSQEIYGIVNSEFNVMAIPDVTWLTLSERNTNDLPHELIPIYYDSGISCRSFPRCCAFRFDASFCGRKCLGGDHRRSKRLGGSFRKNQSRAYPEAKNPPFPDRWIRGLDRRSVRRFQSFGGGKRRRSSGDLLVPRR